MTIISKKLMDARSGDAACYVCGASGKMTLSVMGRGLGMGAGGGNGCSMSIGLPEEALGLVLLVSGGERDLIWIFWRWGKREDTCRKGVPVVETGVEL